jgi:hypothetical protein
MARDVSKTIGEFFEKIIEMSGVDPSMVPQAKGFCWFGNYDEHGKLSPPYMFKWNERSPFNSRMGIVAMFQNEVEARVYAMPVENPGKSEELAFTRHTLSKTAPTFFFEILPPQVFQAEIAEELSVLSNETAHPDDFSGQEEEEELEEAEEVEAKGEVVSEETGAPAT